MFNQKALLLLFCGLMISVATNASADSVIQLNELMSRLSTLQVNFHLEIRDQGSNELLDENTGNLIVKRPGYFYVHTKEPFEQKIISDRKVIWTYDVELEQATSEPVDNRLQQTPFLLLSGDVKAIRANFSVESPESNGTSQRYKLSPNDPKASYDNVELRFESDILTAMSWHNSLGEKSTIQFKDIKINEAVADSKFSFQPPAGVDVIEKESNASSPP
jgi:outer membrane lipoprotein carrier protein